MKPIQMNSPSTAWRESPGVRVGCCGFSTAFALYVKAFRVVEVQQTFYQPPQLKTLEKWRREAPEGFDFTLKAWQLITHEASSPTYRRLREKLTERQKREVGAFRLSETVMKAWQRTLECARALESRVILFQGPARFGPTPQHKANLRNFFRELRRGSATSDAGESPVFVWEPRGEWEAEEVRELCEELRLVHGVDPFQHLPVTGGLGYFRLHGGKGHRYKYTAGDLHQLLEMAKPYSPCYVLFNNISMLEDAKSFLRLAAKS
jgi:uncharacterized protein YecE (DUF72 family)